MFKTKINQLFKFRILASLLVVLGIATSSFKAHGYDDVTH